MAEELIDDFDPVSLEELDERAALLRRVDNKYAVERELFEQLLERLRENHQVLEIDGRREFSYCSSYFDTPELRCYVDHVEDRQPRFKARTRLYEDSERWISLSKYRVGMSLVGGGSREKQPGSELFEPAG